jgi:hypothetical protein
MSRISDDDLKSIYEIRMLKHEYCALADRCASADPGDAATLLANLFVEDGIWTARDTYGGHHRGREAIAHMFSGLSSTFPYGAHMCMNDRIKVAGDHATGQWKSIVPCTWLSGGAEQPSWIFGSYDDEYVRVGGVWYVQTMRSDVQQFFAHQAGWVLP